MSYRHCCHQHCFESLFDCRTNYVLGQATHEAIERLIINNNDINNYLYISNVFKLDMSNAR